MTKCQYCGKDMTKVEGLLGFHYTCSDLALKEWGRLVAIEEAARAFMDAEDEEDVDTTYATLARTLGLEDTDIE